MADAFADPADDVDPDDKTTVEDASNPSDDDVIDTPDGGALVKLSDEDDRRTPGEAPFYANLVDEPDEIDPLELQRVTLDLIDKVALDKQAREDRDKQYADGIKRTGFSDDKVSGADFEGASKVMHPMIGKAAIDFAAKVMKEIFPPSGPCKDKVVGKVTQKKLERARRKTAHMNWQLTEQMPEFRPSLEQLESQVPIGGAQYLQVYYDRQLKRPATEVFWIDNMLLPFAAKSWLSAKRRTAVERITEEEYQRRVSSGQYVDVGVSATGMEPEQTKSEKATEKVEGVKETSLNEDGLRHVFKSFVWLDVEDDVRPDGYVTSPYIMEVDEISRAPLSLRRNWDPDRAERAGVIDELQHVVEFPLIPWRGAQPLGLFHLIGGLSTAATGALRALLDSALMNNSQTVLKLKSQIGGQSQRISQTGVQEIEGAVSIDDIKKLAMPLPFNPPSEVLYQLLGFLTDQAADMIRTSLDNASDDSAQPQPVGTTLANMEQGMTVFSSIHARHHDAMGQVLKILHRINRDWLTEDVVKEDTGELLATPADYQGPMDVVPVSDPRIFSEAQRFAQVQAIAQRAAQNPLYNQVKVEQRILETLKIPNPDELLNNPPEPEAADPVTENVAMALGRPTAAFPNQNHSAHLMVHIRFALDPNLGMNLLVGPAYVPAVLQHIKEHLVLWYAKMMGDVVQRAAHGTPIFRLISDVSPKTADALAKAFAVATHYVQADEAERQTFGMVSQAVQKLMAFAKQVAAMQQPQDPNMVMAQAAGQDVQRKAAADQGKIELEKAKIAGTQQADQVHTQLEQARLQADTSLRSAEVQAKTAAVAGDVHREAAQAQAEEARQQAETATRQAELTLAAHKQQTDAQEGQLRLQLEGQAQAQDHALAAAGQAQDGQQAGADRAADAALEQLRERVKLAINTQDNAAALKITLLELAGDHHVAKLKDGHGLNKNPSP